MASQDLILYEVPALDGELDENVLELDDLEEIEDGIRKMEGTSDLLALIQGVAIVKIEREALWMQAGFASLKEYRGMQGERLGMPKQTISNRRKTAEGWLDNRKAIGRFPLSGHVQKLLFLSEAMHRHKDRRLVMEHFKADSYREFREFTRPKTRRPDLEEVSFAVRDGSLFLDDEAVLAFADGIPAEERDFVSKVLRRAYTARKGNCIPAVLAVYDEGEVRALERYLKKMRAER